MNVYWFLGCAENKRVLSVVQEVIEAQKARGVQLPGEVSSQVDALCVRLLALEMTSLRILTAADAGGTIGSEPSMLKLKGSQLVQAQDQLLFETH